MDKIVKSRANQGATSENDDQQLVTDAEMYSIVKSSLWHVFRWYWGISTTFAIVGECDIGVLNEHLLLFVADFAGLISL